MSRGWRRRVCPSRSIRSNEEPATIAARIVDRNETHEIDNHMVEIGASIGIAMTSPGIGPDHPLRNADMLYRAKVDGRGTYCFFREARESIEAALLEITRHAMANEVQLYPAAGQSEDWPHLDLRAAARDHPVRGSVRRRKSFLSSRHGLIVDLGRWILRRVHECMTGRPSTSRSILVVAVPSSRRAERHRYAARLICRRIVSKSRSPISLPGNTP